MSEFIPFETMEDAFDFMRRGDEYGNRNLHPKQQAITWGDYWIRFVDMHDRLVVFGYIQTLDEVREAEEKYMDRTGTAEERAESEAELQYALQSTKESHERGYMFGWAYSKIDKDLGSTHRFNMWPISKELYEAAREAEWDIDRIHEDYRPQLEEAYTGYREHAIAVHDSGDQP